MLAYITGKLIWSNENTVIISANGVGYEINHINKLTTSDLGGECTLFLTHKLSEYGQNLFGFKTIEEKIIFEQLENIKGIGSRAIFTIMSSLEIDSIAKLHTITLEQLVKLPGIGKTTAQKFLLALSGKLKKEFSLESVEPEALKSLEAEFKQEIALLVEWGMRKADILDYIEQNKSSLEGKSSDQIIQILLKTIRK